MNFNQKISPGWGEVMVTLVLSAILGVYAYGQYFPGI